MIIHQDGIINIFMCINISAQGITLQSDGCQLAYWLTYITAVVILASYSGTVISFLTIRRYGFPFKDVQGFLNASNYLLAITEAENLNAVMVSMQSLDYCNFSALLYPSRSAYN